MVRHLTILEHFSKNINPDGLRSDTQSFKRLIVPRTYRKTLAARSFSCIAPAWWNSLPLHLKMIEDTETLKKQLKTHLY